MKKKKKKKKKKGEGKCGVVFMGKEKNFFAVRLLSLLYSGKRFSLLLTSLSN